MEPSTTIKQMVAGNKIFVPSYQRAYAWDTVPFTKYVAKKKTQQQTLEDIDEQMFNLKR